MNLLKLVRITLLILIIISNLIMLILTLKEMKKRMNIRLKELRKNLKLSQREFGKVLGVTDVAISRLEKGERNITSQMFISICREFNVNEDWLRNGKGEMFNPITSSSNLIDKVAVEYNLDDFQKKIVQEYLNLSAQQKNAVKAFLDKIYNETTEPTRSKFADISNEQLMQEVEERNAELSKRELSASAQKQSQEKEMA